MTALEGIKQLSIFRAHQFHAHVRLGAPGCRIERRPILPDRVRREMDAAAAKRHLAELARAGRYQRDVY